MLAAHLVPGYFVTEQSQSAWKPEWTPRQKALLWVVGLGSTIVPDLDVIYNAVFRGFINHSLLWTHSVFVYMALGFLYILPVLKRWPYLRMVLGLITAGGLSHIALDIVGHGTPLLYPFSMIFVGVAPTRVVEGGIWAYLTGPLFLVEPFLLSLAVIHWAWKLPKSNRFRAMVIFTTVVGLIAFVASFLILLPQLQSIVEPMIGL
jgi:hypothetical protein